MRSPLIFLVIAVAFGLGLAACRELVEPDAIDQLRSDRRLTGRVLRLDNSPPPRIELSFSNAAYEADPGERQTIAVDVEADGSFSTWILDDVLGPFDIAMATAGPDTFPLLWAIGVELPVDTLRLVYPAVGVSGRVALPEQFPVDAIRGVEFRQRVFNEWRVFGPSFVRSHFLEFGLETTFHGVLSPGRWEAMLQFTDLEPFRRWSIEWEDSVEVESPIQLELPLHLKPLRVHIAPGIPDTFEVELNSRYFGADVSTVLRYEQRLSEIPSEVWIGPNSGSSDNYLTAEGLGPDLAVEISWTVPSQIVDAADFDTLELYIGELALEVDVVRGGAPIESVELGVSNFRFGHSASAWTNPSGSAYFALSRGTWVLEVTQADTVAVRRVLDLQESTVLNIDLDDL